MRAPKKIAALLSLSLVATNINYVSANEEITTSQSIIGSGRWETAVEVSKKGWASSETAVIVNESAIADALSATPFAKSVDAPILLTNKDTLQAPTKDELNRLGVKTVYLIGGESVLSEGVKQKIEAMDITVERIAGDSRENTALEIAKKIDAKNDVSEIAVVNGYTGLVDAVSVAAAAAENNMPIIIADEINGISASQEFITSEDIKISNIIGGEAVISKQIENTLPNPNRISGEDRWETNAKVIQKFYEDREINNIYTAKDGLKDEDYLIDAIAVGPLAAKNSSPILIVNEKLNQKQIDVINTKKTSVITQVGASGNENAFKELQEIQKVKTFNVTNIADFNKAIEEANANDIINLTLTKSLLKNNDVAINTLKALQINISGECAKVVVDSPNADITNEATIEKLDIVDNSKGSITNTEEGQISNLTTSESAKDTDITNNGTIEEVVNNGQDTTIENNGTIGDVEGGQTPEISTTVKDLETLKEALLDTEMDAIKIGANITITEDISVNRDNVVIDVNDYTLSLADGKYITVSSDNTTINDANIEGSNVDQALLVTGQGSNLNNISITTKEGSTKKIGYGLKYYATKNTEEAKNILNNVNISNVSKSAIQVNASDLLLQGNVVIANAQKYGVQVDKGVGNSLQSPSLTIAEDAVVNYTSSEDLNNIINKLITEMGITLPSEVNIDIKNPFVYSQNKGEVNGLETSMAHIKLLGDKDSNGDYIFQPTMELGDLRGHVYYLTNNESFEGLVKTSESVVDYVWAMNQTNEYAYVDQIMEMFDLNNRIDEVEAQVNNNELKSRIAALQTKLNDKMTEGEALVTSFEGETDANGNLIVGFTLNTDLNLALNSMDNLMLKFYSGEELVTVKNKTWTNYLNLGENQFPNEQAQSIVAGSEYSTLLKNANDITKVEVVAVKDGKFSTKTIEVGEVEEVQLFENASAEKSANGVYLKFDLKEEINLGISTKANVTLKYIDETGKVKTTKHKLWGSGYLNDKDGKKYPKQFSSNSNYSNILTPQTYDTMHTKDKDIAKVEITIKDNDGNSQTQVIELNK